MASVKPTQLSPSVFLYDPVSQGASDKAEGPKLIILATWIFAQDNHIAKYVASYQKLFPTSSILLLRCYFGHFFQPHAAREELIPAVLAIRSILGTETTSDDEGNSEKPALLLHIFSNSGLGTSWNLRSVYTSTAADTEEKLLPRHATIFDSSPGRYAYRPVVSAIMFGAPPSQPFKRLISLPFAHLLSGGLWTYINVFGGEDWVSFWAGEANNTELVRETRRAYAYSKSDVLVEAGMVEGHAERARGRGFVVECVDFGGSGHVQHARSEPERYWGLVKRTWEGKGEEL